MDAPSIEKIFAGNKGGMPSFLLLTRLRNKHDRDDVPLLGDMRSQLPNLLADRLSPIEFAGFMVLGNTGNQVIKAMPASNPFGRFDNHNTVFYADVNFIPYVESGTFKDTFGKSKSLAVSPFLYFCKHAITSKCITKVYTLCRERSRTIFQSE